MRFIGSMSNERNIKKVNKRCLGRKLKKFIHNDHIFEFPACPLGDKSTFGESAAMKRAQKLFMEVFRR
jgi:hypothetical protein